MNDSTTACPTSPTLGRVDQVRCYCKRSLHPGREQCIKIRTTPPCPSPRLSEAGARAGSSASIAVQRIPHRSVPAREGLSPTH